MVKTYLKNEFTTLLVNPGFKKGILSHLDPYTAFTPPKLA